jgi:hypothetical protein
MTVRKLLTAAQLHALAKLFKTSKVRDTVLAQCSPQASLSAYTAFVSSEPWLADAHARWTESARTIDFTQYVAERLSKATQAARASQAAEDAAKAKRLLEEPK